MNSICGVNCDECKIKDKCKGCANTNGHPWGGDCILAEFCYDKNGNIQSTTSDFNYCFEPNSTCVMCFNSYNTATYRSQTYASYKLNFGEVSKSYYSTIASSAIISENLPVD